MWRFQFGMTSLHIPSANQLHGCLSPTAAPFSPSRDVVAKIEMKRINSPADDNLHIYLFILFVILSLLATEPRSAKPEQ
jgi:hypothetical protein